MCYNRQVFRKSELEEVRIVEREREREKGEGRKETRRKRAKDRERKKKPKNKRIIEVKKVAKEWEIWDKKNKVAKSEKEAKNLISQRFHK